MLQFKESILDITLFEKHKEGKLPNSVRTLLKAIEMILCNINILLF